MGGLVSGVICTIIRVHLGLIIIMSIVAFRARQGSMAFNYEGLAYWSLALVSYFLVQ